MPGEGGRYVCSTQIVILPLADAGHPELDIEVNIVINVAECFVVAYLTRHIN